MFLNLYYYALAVCWFATTISAVDAAATLSSTSIVYASASASSGGSSSRNGDKNDAFAPCGGESHHHHRRHHRSVSAAAAAAVVAAGGANSAAFIPFCGFASIPRSVSVGKRMSILALPSLPRERQRQACNRSGDTTRQRQMMAATEAFSNDFDEDDDQQPNHDKYQQHRQQQPQPQQQQLPQVFATGYSSNPSLSQALREAIDMASSNLPPPTSSSSSSSSKNNNNMIDLAIVFVSSLYDDIGTVLVPQLLHTVMENTLYTGGVQHVLGCTAGGVIGSTTTTTASSSSSSSSKSSSGTNFNKMRPIESESTPAISVTLALLPQVQINTFHIDGRDVPDMKDDYRSSYYDNQTSAASTWKKAIGLIDDDTTSGEHDNKEEDTPIFMILPSPAFQNNLDDFLLGMRSAFPGGQILGGIASTVSSLSRARIFSYSSSPSSSSSSTSPPLLGKDCTRGDGCVGILLRGDIQVDTMVAQGAKPVGGVYRVVATGRDGRKRAIMSSDDDNDDDYDEACRSTIGAIVLDEDATIEDAFETGDENDDDNDNDDDEGEAKVVSTDLKRARLLADYAKARIPKPPLAEANFVMKSLSDDDRAYMRRALLIGLERGGIVGRTPNELLRLAKGEGHRFTVRQVASAGMKDGSVTFPLGSVTINVGDRCRFFVRDGEFARREVSTFSAAGAELFLSSESFHTIREPITTKSFERLKRYGWDIRKRN
jgi:small ligand-binding sensory domain FIST